MGTILGILLAFVIVGLTSGFVIWIVSKLGLGLEVDDFGSAFIAAIVIGVVSGIIHWLMGFLGIDLPGNWLGIVLNIILAAVILMIGGSLLKGLRVAGFVGALIAALAIGVIYGIFAWLLSFI